jgi:hypothetical protein
MENLKQQLTRDFIIPLKKPLAKMLITDFHSLISDILTNEEYEKLIELYDENLKEKGEGRSNFRKIYENEPEIVRIAYTLQDMQNYIINSIDYFNGYWIDKIEFREDYKATYYTNRRNLTPLLKYFTKQGFTLVKFTFQVTTEKTKLENLDNDKSIIRYVLTLNEAAFHSLIEGLFRFVRRSSTVKNGINMIYDYSILTETDFKKSTFTRKYFKYKKTERRIDIDKKFDKKLYDRDIFSICQKYFEHNLSFSDIAKIFGVSKSKIVNICNDPKVVAFYKKVKRYSDNYREYLDKIRAKNRTFQTDTN